ncbi:MAG: phosphatidate cytidylyltransferase [Acidimicrobiales bacterium]
MIHDNTRPHGRIGLAWAVVSVAATIAGPAWIAAWLGLSAFVGASQAAATHRAMEIHPPPWLAAAVSLGPPVAAVFGARYVVGVTAVTLVLALLVRTFVTHRESAHSVSLALLIGTATGAAAASVALTREVDASAAIYLLACACIYDAGAYLVGTGASAAWEGPLAGVVALIPVTILAAVVLVPPFPSGTPLALGLLAAVLAPLGPLAGTAMLGSQEADAPGLRRVDSLMLLGPAWAWLVATIL